MKRLLKVQAAGLLLCIGVTLVASAATEPRWFWWGMGGLLCLVFVPPLIVDAARADRAAVRADRAVVGPDGGGS